MSEVSKWINEVQLMRKEHEAELEKERQRSKVLVEAVNKMLTTGEDWFVFREVKEALKKYEEMGK